MTREEYVLLYEKCAAGDCTEQERRLLEEYRDDFSLDKADWDTDQLGDEQVVINRIYTRLMNRIKKRPDTIWLWYKLPLAAAVILIALCFGLYFHFHDVPVPVTKLQQTAAIVPGSSKAVLTLGDGRKISLTDAANGILAEQAGAKISKQASGQLAYVTGTQAPSPSERAGGVARNTLTVPRGGEYQLVLSDGTKVWLNSASSLRFPAKFTGKERRVELTGEAYFEVAKAPLIPQRGKHSLSLGEGRGEARIPFIVTTANQEIEVLGTHFNVNAYNSRVTTTLLEGSVKLKSAGYELMLKPGQSGIRQPEGNFKAEPADIEAAVAWKNGYFVFHDEDIKSIMEQISRWYNVDVVYQGDVSNKAFYAKISRSEDITELLKNMEITGVVHFKIEAGNAFGKGRRVIVMP
ncbi:DUF4974 domain-containing protein [Pedobacter sp. BS3]|uniref:FecR family protein n=1 Tax=Pedobacter sp. BS3 TaxID=2567937 RepID=UPI0011EBA335|nr:FecR family protein [Pedobacter sp. BS3]TZF84919.1 DUF4974 domain-containing protein [Pedobacter sp. BS3]